MPELFSTLLDVRLAGEDKQDYTSTLVMILVIRDNLTGSSRRGGRTGLASTLVMILVIRDNLTGSSRRGGQTGLHVHIGNNFDYKRQSDRLLNILFVFVSQWRTNWTTRPHW